MRIMIQLPAIILILFIFAFFVCLYKMFSYVSAISSQLYIAFSIQKIHNELCKLGDCYQIDLNNTRSATNILVGVEYNGKYISLSNRKCRFIVGLPVIVKVGDRKYAGYIYGCS